jgi:hypothetical protein
MDQKPWKDPLPSKTGGEQPGTNHSSIATLAAKLTTDMPTMKSTRTRKRKTSLKGSALFQSRKMAVINNPGRKKSMMASPSLKNCWITLINWLFSLQLSQGCKALLSKSK